MDGQERRDTQTEWMTESQPRDKQHAGSQAVTCTRTESGTERQTYTYSLGQTDRQTVKQIESTHRHTFKQAN